MNTIEQTIKEITEGKTREEVENMFDFLWQENELEKIEELKGE